MSDSETCKFRYFERFEIEKTKSGNFNAFVVKKDGFGLKYQTKRFLLKQFKAREDAQEYILIAKQIQDALA